MRNRTTFWLAKSACLALLGAISTSAASLPIPETYAELANRVLLRTAPNGAEIAVRLLSGNTFEPSGGYKTNRADYTRAGLPEGQGLLVLASTDTFGTVYSWQTNRLLLTFASPTNGTYEAEFTINTVPGIQKASGPFGLTLGNNLAPRITQQPQSGAYVNGQNVSALSLGALGFDLGFQWYRADLAVPGATKSSYPFIPMGADKVGDWYVVVTNSMGAVTSAVAHVELATVPKITQPPQPVQALEGTAATFTVSATGGGLNYGWLFNGINAGLPNAPTITVTNVSSARAGFWSVRVFNNAGTTTSSPTRLRMCSAGLNHTWQQRPWVRILRSGDPVPDSDASFGPLKTPFNPLFTIWNQTIHATARGDQDDPNSSLFRNALVRWRDGALTTLVFTNTPIPGGDGPFTYPFYPTDEGNGGVNFQEGSMYEWRASGVIPLITPSTPVPGRPEAKFGPSGSFARRDSGVVISSTIDLGLVAGNPAGIFYHDGTSLVRIADETTDLPGTMTGYAYRATEDSVNFDGETIVFSTMASLNGEGGVYRATKNGVVTKLLDSNDPFPGLTNSLAYFGDVDVEGGLVFAVIGVKSGATVQNRVVKFEADGAAQSIGSGDFLVAGGPRLVYFGNAGQIQRWSDGSLETIINTQALLDCQRVKAFTDVEAQGNDVAIGVEFTDGTAGIYANFGAPTTGQPKILAQPQPVVAPRTAPATFSVAASGPGNLVYQWYKDGNAISGATNTTYTLFSAEDDSVGNYHVTVTATTGVVMSDEVGLSLAPPPSVPLVYIAPTNQAVPIGTSAVLRVVAAGEGPLHYRWTKGGQEVASGPSPELAFAAVTAAEHGAYTVVVSNAVGSSTAYVANISVTPLITQHPISQNVPLGGTATLSVEASGFDQLRFTWLKDLKAIAGKTNATLILENVQTSDAGSYSVMVSGVGAGSLRSNAAILTVGNGQTGTELRLGQALMAAGKLTFSLATTAGKVYQVQHTSSLSPSNWSTMETITGDGSSRTVTVSPAGAVGFVRVFQTP